MNLPNKLTTLRIILVPVFVILFYLNLILPALIVFIIASLTDTLDGRIARRKGLVSNFGKLMDPLADKILVMSAMLCFVERAYCPAWVAIILLSREFLVTSLRLIAASEGTVIAADIFGKLKTFFQMTWIVVECLGISLSSFAIGKTILIAAAVLMWISTILSTLSGFNYCFKNRKIFLENI